MIIHEDGKLSVQRRLLLYITSIFAYAYAELLEPAIPYVMIKKSHCNMDCIDTVLSVVRPPSASANT